jgi:tRNA threonylcarbamoyladenosine biosynthesis protein TsaB
MILAIDTAGVPSQLILASEASKQDRKIIGQQSWQERYSQSRKTLKLIDQLLKKKQRSLADLSLIIVNQGPTSGSGQEASFTGLKIGATIANSLALVLKIPVVGISLEGRPLEEIVRKSDFSNQKKDFVEPIYPRPANVGLPAL